MNITRRTLFVSAVALAVTVPGAGLANAAMRTAPVSVSTTRTAHPMLSLGSRGPAVDEVQNILFTNGYGDAAGSVFDRHTRDEVVAFQKDHHLRADGVVGPRTWAALEAVAPKPVKRTTIQVGARGNQVEYLQQALNSAGYRIPVTGYFGSMTRAAVIDLQKKHHLAADGIVGARTWPIVESILPEGD